MMESSSSKNMYEGNSTGEYILREFYESETALFEALIRIGLHPRVLRRDVVGPSIGFLFDDIQTPERVAYFDKNKNIVLTKSGREALIARAAEIARSFPQLHRLSPEELEEVETIVMQVPPKEGKYEGEYEGKNYLYRGSSLAHVVIQLYGYKGWMKFMTTKGSPTSTKITTAMEYGNQHFLSNGLSQRAAFEKMGSYLPWATYLSGRFIFAFQKDPIYSKIDTPYDDDIIASEPYHLSIASEKTKERLVRMLSLKPESIGYKRLFENSQTE